MENNGSTTETGKIPQPHGGALRNWVKGQSGNPAGRGVGVRNRSTIYREWLECKAMDGGDGDKADEIARAQIEKACKGDTQAAKEVMDSAHGKVADKNEITGANGSKLEVHSTITLVGTNGKRMAGNDGQGTGRADAGIPEGGRE